MEIDLFLKKQMDTLPSDLVGTIVQHLPIDEIAILQPTTNINVHMSVKDIAKKEEYSFVMYFMKKRYDDSNLLLILKYLVAYGRFGCHMFNTIMGHLNSSRYLGEFKYLYVARGAIMIGNFELFKKYFLEFLKVIDGSDFQLSIKREISLALKTAIRYKRMDVIDFCISESNWSWKLSTLLQSRYGDDMDLLDYVVEKTTFSDWNRGMANMAKVNNIMGMEYFLKKGATNIEECHGIGWYHGYPDVVSFCEKQCV